MILKKYIYFLIFFAALQASLFAQSIPDSSFTMRLENFDEKIYKQAETTYTIETPNIDFRLPETATQTTVKSLVSNGKKFIYLKSKNRKFRKPPSGKDLSDSYLLTMRDSNIKSAAAKLKKSSNIIKSTSQFVYDRIKNKKIGIPLIPANSIYKNRSGDCTEHAVLTVSLLRSMGIPSRAVVGVFLAPKFSAKKNILVYHMWAEAFYEGGWRIVDATRPWRKRSNVYIAFAYHDLITATPLKYLSQMSGIYGMKIKYLKGK